MRKPLASLVAGGTLTCAQTTVELMATRESGQPGDLYQFAGPAGGPTGIVSQNASAGTAEVNLAGLYSVTVTNTATGCSNVTSTSVSQNTAAPSVRVSPASATLTCDTRLLSLTASGGVGLSVSGYQWSNNFIDRVINVNSPGTYSVVVTDINGCRASASVVVDQQSDLPALVVVASGTLTCAQTTVTLRATGGDTYEFQGMGIVSQDATAGTAVVNSGGTFGVIVSNTATGCSNSTLIEVSQNTSPPTVSISATSGTLTCAVTAVTLTATISGTGLLWSNAATTPSITVNSAGTYSVTATGGNGCSAVSNSITVQSNTASPTSANLTASNSGTLTCSVQALTITALATGSSLSYAFAGPSGTLVGSGNTRPVSVSGLYSVTITGSNGCTTSVSTTVFSNTAAPTAGLVASGTITCSIPAVTLIASGLGTYSFSGPGIVSTSGNLATVNLGGTYSVTVLNPTNGCFATNTVSVSSDLSGASSAPTLSASSSVVCVGVNVQVVATVGGTPSGLQWYRNPATAGQGPQLVAGQTSATLSLGGVQQAQAGSYVLVVSGGCSVTSTAFSLTVNPLPTVTLLVPNNASVAGSVITLPAPLTGVNFQVLGGVSFERLIIVDRINGYEIRQVDSNTNGAFPITRTGPFRLTVTDGNGCQRTVEGTVQTQ